MNSQNPKHRDMTFVSLGLLMHLFCVVVVLSSNFSPSAIQTRLVEVVAPYTKTLHLDPNFTPFHLTSSNAAERMHQWLVTPPTGQLHAFPDGQWRGGFQRARLDMLARVGAAHAATEADAMPAEIARALVRHVHAAAKKSDHPESKGIYRVRCVQHVGEHGDLSTQDIEPMIGSGVNLVYDADVWWVERTHQWNVLKRLPESRSAPIVTTDSKR